MPLFMDGPISSIEDLTAQDSQLPAVAGGEGIDVTRKLALAQEEIGLDVTGMLGRLSRADSRSWLSLPNVVVTPALKLWHTYRTLEVVYADAYNSQLNDRYAGRRDQFREMAKRARERLMEIGVGMTLNPVPQAATPAVAPAPGRALAAETYFVTTAWMNGRGDEGASSAPAAIAVSGTTLLVTPGDAPDGVAAWNVYLGTDPEEMVLQNDAAIPIGQTWLQPSPPAPQGRQPGTGQSPDFLKPLPRLIQRG
jgi:hypothetical protein